MIKATKKVSGFDTKKTDDGMIRATKIIPFAPLDDPETVNYTKNPNVVNRPDPVYTGLTAKPLIGPVLRGVFTATTMLHRAVRDAGLASAGVVSGVGVPFDPKVSDYDPREIYRETGRQGLLAEVGKLFQNIGSFTSIGALQGEAVIKRFAPAQNLPMVGDQDYLSRLRQVREDNLMLGGLVKSAAAQLDPNIYGYTIVRMSDGEGNTYDNRVRDDQAASFMMKMEEEGWKVDSARRSGTGTLDFNVLGIQTNVMDVAGFVIDVMDPVSAAIGGKVVTTTVKGIRAAGRAAKLSGPVKKATDAIAGYADRAIKLTDDDPASPGQMFVRWVDKAVGQMEREWGANIRPTTVQWIKNRFWPASLRGRAEAQQVANQVNTMGHIIRGDKNTKLYKLAERHSLGKASRREEQALAGFLESVGWSVDDSDLIVKIANLPDAHKVKLDELAHAFAGADTTLDEILEARETFASMGVGARYAKKLEDLQVALGVAQREMAEIGETVGRFTPIGEGVDKISRDDFMAIVDALRLPKSGKEIPGLPRIAKDFAEVLQGRTLKKLRGAELTKQNLIAEMDHFFVLHPERQTLISQAFHLIEQAQDVGASHAVISRMKEALVGAAKHNFTDIYKIEKQVPAGAVKKGLTRLYSLADEADPVWTSRLDDVKNTDGTIQYVDVVKKTLEKTRVGEDTYRLNDRFLKKAKPYHTIETETMELGDVIRGYADVETLIQSSAGKIKEVEANLMRGAVLTRAEQEGLDPEVVKRIGTIAAEMDKGWGKMLLQLGLITPDQFNYYAGMHLRRAYEIFRSRDLGEILTELHKRAEQVSEHDAQLLGKIEEEFQSLVQGTSALARYNYYPGVVSRRLGMGRNESLSVETRRMMGETTRLSDALILGGSQVARDLDRGTVLQMLAETGVWSSKSLVGSNMIRIKDAPEFGALRGLWMPKPLAERVLLLGKIAGGKENEIEKIARDSVRVIKNLQVVQNPVTRTTNAVSNIIGAMTGSDTYNLRHFAAAMREAAGDFAVRGADWQEYAKLSPSMGAASLMAETQMRALLSTEKHGLLERLIMQNPIGTWANNTMQWEESVAKLTMFKLLKKKGLSAQEAVLQAEKWGVDYGDVNVAVDALRRRFGLFPFMTYAYKMTGNLIKAPIEHPGVLTALGRTAAAYSAEMVDPKVKDIQRELLPDWMQDPFNMPVVLPGGRVLMLGSMMPWAIFSQASYRDDSTPAALMPLAMAFGALGWPFKQAIELAYNRDFFRDQDIYSDEMTGLQKAEKISAYIFGTVPQKRLADRVVWAWRGLGMSSTQDPKGSGPKAGAAAFADAVFKIRDVQLDQTWEWKYKELQAKRQSVMDAAIRAQRAKNLNDGHKAGVAAHAMRRADELGREMDEVRKKLFKVGYLEELLRVSGASGDQIADMAQWLNERALDDRERREGFETFQRIREQPGMENADLLTAFQYYVANGDPAVQIEGAPASVKTFRVPPVDTKKAQTAERKVEIGSQAPGTPLSERTGNPTPSLPPQ